MNQKDDATVWLAFRKGDAPAFSFLFHTYYTILYQYGIKISPDPDLVKDTIQDLFIHLWESRHRLGETASIKFYLLKSLRRKLLRAMQKQKKLVAGNRLPDDYEFEVVFSAENAIITEEASQRQLQQLLQALNSLLPRQKEAIYLRLFNNFSYDEISEIMEVNVQTVRNYVHQALTELRKKMPVYFSVPMISLLLQFTSD